MTSRDGGRRTGEAADRLQEIQQLWVLLAPPVLLAACVITDLLNIYETNWGGM